MDDNPETNFLIEVVASADYEEWCELASELWPPEDEEDRADLRQTMTDILNSERETGWLVRDTSGAAMAFMNLSRRQDYVPIAPQRSVTFVAGTYAWAPYRRRILGLRFLRLLSNQGTPVIVGHGCG